MSSQAGQLQLPRRSTLASQAAAALRQAISDRMWQEFLPSERRLCALLQVSRPTIRAALRTLAQEELVEISPGRCVRLLHHPRKRGARKSSLIALISDRPISRQPLTAYQGISTMELELTKRGFRTDEFICLAQNPRLQRRKLEAYLEENEVLGCVLLSVGRDVQHWFASHSIPSLVLGSCHPDVRLPSLDVDYRAVCRHAAGVFRRHGHQHLAFIAPDSGLAGDLASEVGFREGATGVTATVLRHNGTRAHLRTRLGALLAAPRPPTALLVAKPAHTLSVLLHLLHRGIRVPDAISVIARDHDPLYEHELAHYALADDSFARRLSRLMLQMVGQGHLPAEPSLIFPRFVAGETVRAVKA